jgi:glycosyltransferase involved in cell wall biosynthesis
MMPGSPQKPINVCLDFSRAYGGVVKAIEDFQSALGGPILSFDDRSEPRIDSPIVNYVDEVSSFLGKRHLRLSAQASREASAFLEAANPDLMIAHSMFRGQCGWTRREAKRRACPYWSVPHGSLDPWVFTYGGGFKRAWMAFSGRRYLRDAAAVVFATRREMDKAKHIYEGPNMHVVHWPVDLLELSEKEAARVWLREYLSIGSDERILLYLGRYDGMKRPLETIEAFAKARAEGLHLVLVGNDSGLNKAELESKVQSLNLTNCTHVTGPLFGEDKNRALLGADGFISLSHRENFGYTTGEALSASIPVILSPGNDLAMELEGEDCGWCLEGMGLDEASAAIHAFSETSLELLNAKGQSGRAWCEAYLKREKFYEGLLGLPGVTGQDG